MPRGVRGSRSSSPALVTELHPTYPPNLKRSLLRNDAELAALTKLHVALRTLKRAIVEEYGEGVLVEGALREGEIGGAASIAKDAKQKETEAEKGEEEDKAADPKAARLRQLTTAFRLRMKLRRRLLNRLARRLHRVAHVLDGGQCQAPLPPSYGDVVRRYVTEKLEQSGLAPALLGGELDQVCVIRERDVKELERREGEWREVREQIEKQRRRRLGGDEEGLDGGEEGAEEKDEDKGDNEPMEGDDEPSEEDAKAIAKALTEATEEDDAAPKSDVDRLLEGDAEDAPLLEQLKEYEPGYDKVYSIGPPPPLPPPGASPSKKGAPKKSGEEGKEDDKEAPASPAAAEATEADHAPPRTGGGPTETQILQTSLPIARTTDTHEVDGDGTFLAGPKSDTATASSRCPFALSNQNQQMRSLHPKERAEEWQRWTRQMCEAMPDQCSFAELGVGGKGVVFDAENRKKRGREEDDEEEEEADKAVVRGRGGKVLRKSVSPEKAKKDEDEEGDNADEAKAEDAATAKADDDKAKKGADKPADLAKKPSTTKTFSLVPVPSFHYQDLKRVRVLQNEFVKYRGIMNTREKIQIADARYKKAFAYSMDIQQKQAAARAAYTNMRAAHKRDVENVTAQGQRQYAAARAHWEKRQGQLRELQMKLGKEEALVRDVANDVLQDVADRVTLRTADDLALNGRDGLGTDRLRKAVIEAKNEGNDAKLAAATVLGHVLDGVERRHRDEQASRAVFAPPVLPRADNVVADPKKGDTMAQVHAREESELKTKLQKLNELFAEAEKKRGEAWQALAKAKGGSGGQPVARKVQRGRKSAGTASSQARVTAAAAASHAYQGGARPPYPVQMQVQQPQQRVAPRPAPVGYPVHPGYYQPQQRQPSAVSMIAQNLATAQMHNQMMAQQQAHQAAARTQAAQIAQMQTMARNVAAVGVPVASGGPFHPAPNAAVPGSILVPGAATAGGQPPMQPGVVPGPPGQRTVYNYGDRYSQSNINARKNPDGTIVPASTPKLLPDGTFARPAGRQRKGMGWDAQRGCWYPMSEGQEEG